MGVLAMFANAAQRLTALRWSWDRRDPRHLTLAAALLVLVGGVFPLYLGIELTRGIKSTGPRSFEAATRAFDRQGYDHSAPTGKRAAVPRVFLTALPRDLPDLDDTAARKRAFTLIVLPLVLRANEILANERRQVLELAARIEAGRAPRAAERAWIEAMATRYGLKTTGAPSAILSTLKRRVDIVPPSLAIAQAAIESGWGSSRFALEGNALFGQWDEEGVDGMVPADRDPGRTYAIKRFDSLLDSILDYMRNLNSHRAYRKFRAHRAELREAGQPLAGPELAQFLGAYSQQGQKYLRALNSIITGNDLAPLDGANLSAS